MVSKKLKILVLSTAAVGMIFTACTKRQETAGTAGAAASGQQNLIIGMKAHPAIADFKNNYLTHYLEKMHNVTLDFYMLPTDGGEDRTKLALMVAANDLPDIIIPNGDLGREAILDYGSKGAFIALNKYLSDPVKAPNFNALPEADRAIIFNNLTSADGNIYALPRFEPSSWNMTPHRLFFNRAWADKLGLKVPATTDELREVLIAFRDGDPNGNGRKDEIGLYGWFGGGYGENIITALLNSFIFYNQGQLALDDTGNTVIAPFTQPAFRKGLIYLNQLYKDGVLAASLFTDNQQQFRATLNSEPAVVGITTAGSYSNWMDANNNPNYKQLQFIPPLIGPDGVCYTPYQEYVPAAAAMITSKCKNPDLAFKVMESFYNLEVTLVALYGEEGVDWTRTPDEISKYTNGYVTMGLYPAVDRVELTSIWNDPNSKFWHRQNPLYHSVDMGHTLGSRDYDANLPTAVLQPFNYQNYLDKHPKYLLPTLNYSMDDALNNAQTIITIGEYIQQSIAEFVTSARDINSDAAWNAYLRELDNMGLKQWIDTAQTTYNRQR